MIASVVLLPVWAVAQPGRAAVGDNCFTVEGEAGRALRGTVRTPDSSARARARALGGCAPFELTKASPMMRRIDGIAALLEPRDVRALAATVMRRAPGLRPDEHAEPLYDISLCDTTERRRLRITLCPDGAMWAQVMENDAPVGEPTPIDRGKFLELAEPWSWYAREVDADPATDEPAGATPAVFELPHPYVPSRWILDRDTLSNRLLRGRTPRIPPADRVLELEKLMVRLPRGYSPRQPAGLLVWMSPDDEGSPPEPLHAALDAAGIIAVGFNKCGNTRPVANRYQLALDAVATATRRYHVDSRRVYVSGLSGGGRVASVLVACFPDVFTGAIPIVGLNAPEPVPMAGGRVVPPAFARPSGRMWDLFRQRRVAAITGGRDFNQPEIIAAAQVLRTDGVPVQVFEHLDMGHELPTAERFETALRWVDEPWRKQRDREIELGERELRAARARAGSGEQQSGDKPLSDAGRAAFIRVTEVAPWTPAAWAAIERLNAAAAPQTPSSPDP
jgi:predicted esterase